RRDGHERRFSQQTSTHVELLAERYAAEPAPINVRHAVVSGQTLVDERVIRIQQLDDVAVLPNDAVEEQLRLAAHGLAKIVVEVGKQERNRDLALQAAQVQPLSGEVRDERLRAGIRQHPPHLPLERGGIPELLLPGELDQLVVGDAAPQKK